MIWCVIHDPILCIQKCSFLSLAESESRSTSFECSSWPNDSIDSGIRNSSESKQQESVTMKLRHRLDEAKQVFNPIRAKNSSRIQGRLFKFNDCF